jgi:ABC-2 type transport system ATP-binding protein
MNNILKINNLSKKYGRIQALDNLELTIGQGQIWGILGPNGSGKTTTLGIILGILHQDGGDFEWFEGKYGQRFNMKIGAILETPNFYPYLNAIDNLKIVAQIKKAESDDIHHLLEIVDLSHRKKSPFKTYSLGMKQRLAIAATLIGNPEVLIFDEPTNGLDPQGIAEVRSILKRIADTGKTVIMASHMLDEVEKICDHVAIIKKGKLLASGKIGQIIHDDKIVEIGAEDNDKLKHWIEINGWKYSKAANIGFEIQIPKDYEHALINKKAFEDGILLNHLIVKKRRLEEEFLHITKN